MPDSQLQYISLFYRVGTLSIASAGLLGWLMALEKSDPAAVRRLGIRSPRRITNLHIDQVMMGLILISARTACPDLPNRFAGPLLVGTILNPLGFAPLMFWPSADKTIAYRMFIIPSFLSSTVGFVGLAYWAWVTKKI